MLVPLFCWDPTKKDKLVKLKDKMKLAKTDSEEPFN